MLTKDDVQVIRDAVREELKLRLSKTDKTLTHVNRSLESMDSRIGAIDSKIELMDSRIESMELRIESIESKIETMDLKMETLHNKLDKKIDILRTETMDAIERVLATVDELNTTMDKRVKRLEEHCQVVS